MPRWWQLRVRSSGSGPAISTRAPTATVIRMDMVESGYRLITEGLDVAHLRLIIGSSMGGMHAWMWAEMYQRQNVRFETLPSTRRLTS